MDFWAQHKDFVLKVLAGLGVFLVALIARGVTFGDELENERGKNLRTAGKVTKLKLASDAEVSALEDARDTLRTNAVALAGEIGWNRAEEGVGARLIESILSRTRRYRQSGEESRRGMVADARNDIRADINGGFGLLRGTVHDDLSEEASERNIPLPEGLGFAGVLQLEEEELQKYLLQLELSARLLRYAIDARVIAVDEVRITTRNPNEVIPGANPEFLIEYPVTIEFRATQEAATQILNRLENEQPRVPWRSVGIFREERPPNSVGVKLEVVAVATNPEVKIAKPENKEG